jgi:hypothetical protein
MTDRIEPALSADEWKASSFKLGAEWWDGTVSGDEESVHIESGTDPQESAGPIRGPRLASLIALANAALPDSDPRKITRARVDALRFAASSLRHECGSDDEDARDVEAIADALESYLPPE